MKEVVIIDLGIGNLYSLKSAIEHLNYKPIITDDPKILYDSNQIILPGDGAFKYAVDIMKKKNLFETLKNLDFKKNKLLGICLGMQLLLNNSSEFEKSDGLGIIPGENVKLKEKSIENESIDIPHINWRHIEFNQKKDDITKVIEKDDEFYFIHSYLAQPENAKHLIAFYNYAGNKIPAIIKKDLAYGFQFHPEKSGKPGLRLLKQFLKS
jgi:glutamine amidotransferase